MSKVESLSIKYLGCKEPQTEEEVRIEVLGLKTAIASAQQRLAILEQGMYFANLKRGSVAEEKNEKTINSAPSPTENK